MKSRSKVTAFKVQDINMKAIKLDKLLGSGSYGQVYVGKWNNTVCAIKYFEMLAPYTIEDLNDNAESKRSFDDEIKALAFLSEKKVPNIIGFFGVVRGLSNYLVMEYASNGDLQSHIDRAYNFPRPIRYNIMIDLTTAVRFMHVFELLHNDIKPANILLTADYQAKLCDFGLVASCEEAKKRCLKAGSEYFAAPELLVSGPGHVTKGSDMYTLGLTFWGMLNKKNPFAGLTDVGVQKRKLTGAPVKIGKIGNSQVRRLFKSCWQLDVEKRPSAEHALQILIKARDHQSLRKK